jgi:hypothetical protein
MQYFTLFLKLDWYSKSIKYINLFLLKKIFNWFMMNFPLEIIVELKIQVNPIIKVWSSHQSIIIIF